MTKDPARLLDSGSGGSPALRHLVEAGRSELPNEQQLASLESKLGPILDPPPGGGSGSGPDPGAAPAAASGGLSLGVKVTIGAGLLAAGIGGVVAPSLLSDPVPPTLAPAISASVEVAPPPAPVATSAQTRRVDSFASASAVVSQPVHTSKPPSSDAARSLDPVAEARLLEQARHALATQPARALELCAQHAREFPRGLLSQEREVITIQALARSGRVSEAKARARRFAEVHPRSAHLRRLAHLLVDAGAPDAG